MCDFDRRRTATTFWHGSSTDTTIDDAVHVTGPYDYLLHIRVCDTADLDRLLRRLKTSAEAAQTQTRIALRSRR